MIEFNLPTPELPPPGRAARPALPAGAFPAASLGVWLELASKAGVALVPAEKVGELPIEALLRFEEVNHEPTQAAMAELDRINQGLGDNQMLRWDCCAGFDIKMGMSHGERPSGTELHLFPGEPRTFDLLYDFPGDTIALWKRPWIQAQDIDGFPVEFRVFVGEGQVIGVANYYLQRDLPATPEILAAARRCVLAARKIVETMEATALTPAMPGMSEAFLQKIGRHGSLDFLVTPAGEVLFLEGGPGFGFGAHPCAYLNSQTDTVDDIEGLKLAAGQPAITADDSFFQSVDYKRGPEADLRGADAVDVSKSMA